MTTPITRARAKLRAVYRFQHASRMQVDVEEDAENGQVEARACQTKIKSCLPVMRGSAAGHALPIACC